MATVTATPIQVSDIGLITGQPVQVEITPAPAGHGIVFYIEGVSPIPAHHTAAVHLDRGVTLANAEGKTLSIVEHFLCAANLAGQNDLKVSVSGAPELPILDGSARDWLDLFQTQWGLQVVAPSIALPEAVFYRHSEQIALYAIPDSHFKITYSVDFNHPELKNQWVRWDSRADDPARIVDAVTFGYLSELPAMQAKGLALGAGPENSLGLIETGGYSRPLRHESEPVYHKALDLIGDLSLAGFNPLALKAHVFALNAGHSSHVPFARKLLKALRIA